MTVIVWTALAVAAATGAGFAAVSQSASRRTTGLTLAAAAIGGLLLVLGADLAAIAWLALGGALLPLVVRRPGPVQRPPRPAALAGMGVVTLVFFAALYRVILQTDWRPLPNQGPRALVAEAGGRGLTADLALFLAAALLVTAVLVAAAWSGEALDQDPGDGKETS